MLRTRASIDLGTNTCLLLIAECEGERIDRVLLDRAQVVRLGQDVDRGRRLVDEAIERTLKTLKEYAQACKEHGADPKDAICVATSQARDAENGEEVFKQFESETGFRFQTISGAEEARLTYLGAILPDMNSEKIVVIDIGGGSTEYQSHTEGISLDLGSVRYTERFLKSDPVTDEEYELCRQEIARVLSEASLPEGSELLAVAGTATTLAAWHLGVEEFDQEAVSEVRLSVEMLDQKIAELKERTVSERKQLTGIEPKRADVLLAGAMILRGSMRRFGIRETRISPRGLRYGLLRGRVNR